MQVQFGLELLQTVTRETGKACSCLVNKPHGGQVQASAEKPSYELLEARPGASDRSCHLSNVVLGMLTWRHDWSELFGVCRHPHGPRREGRQIPGDGRLHSLLVRPRDSSQYHPRLLQTRRPNHCVSCLDLFLGAFREAFCFLVRGS